MNMNKEAMKQALKQAFQLGQDYWYQADHEFYSQNKKSDATRAKFEKLIEDTCQALAKQEHGEPVAVCECCEKECPVIYLPQPKQEQGEPVAWLGFNDRGECREVFTNDMCKMMPNYSVEGMTPVYITLPQRTWVGLTDEEILNLWQKTWHKDSRMIYDFARAIEVAHGIGEKK